MHRFTLYLLVVGMILFVPQNLWADKGDDGKAPAKDSTQSIDQHRPAPPHDGRPDAKSPQADEERPSREHQHQAAKGPEHDGPMGQQAQPGIAQHRENAGGPDGSSRASNEGRPARGREGFGPGGPGRESFQAGYGRDGFSGEQGRESFQPGPGHQGFGPGSARHEQYADGQQGRFDRGPESYGPQAGMGQGPRRHFEAREEAEFGRRFGLGFGPGYGPDFRMGPPMHQTAYARYDMEERGYGCHEFGPPHQAGMRGEEFQRGPQQAYGQEHRGPAMASQDGQPQQGGLLKVVFNRLDSNHDGQLSFVEFSQGVKSLLGFNAPAGPGMNCPMAQQDEHRSGPAYGGQKFQQEQGRDGFGHGPQAMNRSQGYGPGPGMGPMGFARGEFGQRQGGPRQDGWGPMGGHHGGMPDFDRDGRVGNAGPQPWMRGAQKWMGQSPDQMDKSTKRSAEVAQQTGEEKSKSDKPAQKSDRPKPSMEKGHHGPHGERPAGPPPADKPESTPEK